jgi:hypothetical protein
MNQHIEKQSQQQQWSGIKLATEAKIASHLERAVNFGQWTLLPDGSKELQRRSQKLSTRTSENQQIYLQLLY